MLIHFFVPRATGPRATGPRETVIYNILETCFKQVLYISTRNAPETLVKIETRYYKHTFLPIKVGEIPVVEMLYS